MQTPTPVFVIMAARVHWMYSAVHLSAARCDAGDFDDGLGVVLLAAVDSGPVEVLGAAAAPLAPPDEPSPESKRTLYLTGASLSIPKVWVNTLMTSFCRRGIEYRPTRVVPEWSKSPVTADLLRSFCFASRLANALPYA
ncbi:MAG TPA: hypothetical protein VLI65_05340, partial [Pyrinomonadaceae bacterium]|nr:hypothetical protein [Pyrinomonadaceae bacterium]